MGRVKQLDKLVDKIRGVAGVRAHINEVLWKRMKKLGEVFFESFFYEGQKKPDAKRLSDLFYYTGGWPHENTPPKAKDLAHDISIAYNFFRIAGYDDFEKYLAENGLGIVVLDPEKAKVVFDKQKFAAQVALFNEVEPEHAMAPRAEPQAAFLEIVERCMDVQGEICAQADKIKLRAAVEASAEHKIQKKNFIIAVNNESKRGLDFADKFKAGKFHQKTLDSSSELTEIETAMKKEDSIRA